MYLGKSDLIQEWLVVLATMFLVCLDMMIHNTFSFNFMMVGLEMSGVLCRT